MEAFRETQVGGELGLGGDGLDDLVVVHQRGPHVAAEQDLGLAVVELEIAFGVEEVSRYRVDVGVAHRDDHARVGDADNAALGAVGRAEVGQETLPQGGDVEGALGGGEPFVERGDDVRILVRGEDILQLLEGEKPVHGHDQGVVGHVAGRVDQRALAVGDDEKLIGLHRLACGIIHQIVEHQTLVVAVVE